MEMMVLDPWQRYTQVPLSVRRWTNRFYGPSLVGTRQTDGQTIRVPFDVTVMVLYSNFPLLVAFSVDNHQTRSLMDATAATRLVVAEEHRPVSVDTWRDLQHFHLQIQLATSCPVFPTGVFPPPNGLGS